MPAPIERFRVFVASPSDVISERESLARVVNELNLVLTKLVHQRSLALELVRWETHVRPAMGRTQEIINNQIGDFDVFVGIMWKRFGTPTGVAESGTEEEFRSAYGRWNESRRPELLMYFCQAPMSIGSKEELEQYGRVLAFRQELQDKGLVWTYGESRQFADVIRPHLVMVIGDILAQTSAVDSAQAIGNIALGAEVAAVRDRALDLARDYERIRARLPSGAERTRRLELVMTEMRALAPLIYPMLDELVRSESPGERLLALSILQQTPTRKYYEWLRDRMGVEKPFVSYHAAVALLAAARYGDSREPGDGRELRNAIARAMDLLGFEQRDSDTYRVLITADREVRRSNAHYNPAADAARLGRQLEPGTYSKLEAQLRPKELIVAIYRNPQGGLVAAHIHSQRRLREIESLAPTGGFYALPEAEAVAGFGRT